MKHSPILENAFTKPLALTGLAYSTYINKVITATVAASEANDTFSRAYAEDAILHAQDAALELYNVTYQSIFDSVNYIIEEEQSNEC